MFEHFEASSGRLPLLRPISVHDLLAHTSGIGFGPGFGYDPENAYESSYVPLVRKVDLGEIQSLAEWCQELAKVPLRREAKQGTHGGSMLDPQIMRKSF